MQISPHTRVKAATHEPTFSRTNIDDRHHCSMLARVSQPLRTSRMSSIMLGYVLTYLSKDLIFRLVRGHQRGSRFGKYREATRSNGVKTDASARPLSLSSCDLDLWPFASELLWHNGIYRTICLSDLVKIRLIVLEITRRTGFMWSISVTCDLNTIR